MGYEYLEATFPYRRSGIEYKIHLGLIHVVSYISRIGLLATKFGGATSSIYARVLLSHPNNQLSIRSVYQPSKSGDAICCC